MMFRITYRLCNGRLEKVTACTLEYGDAIITNNCGTGWTRVYMEVLPDTPTPEPSAKVWDPPFHATEAEPLFTAFEVSVLGHALTKHLLEITPKDTSKRQVTEAEWKRFIFIQRRVLGIIAKVVENGEKE
jgi:hypothetical protein